jgi:hypothetical protein
MPRFKVAHIREQGNDMIIILVASSFGSKSSSDQQQAQTELQLHARAAGLAGIVVPVWDSGGGRMRFFAPHQWHPFFTSINLQFIAANINKELFW